MSGSHSMRLLIATIITSLLSIVCFIVSYFVNVWWTVTTGNVDTIQGLWKACQKYQNGTEICTERTDLLSFKAKKGTDPIITCIIISVVFTIFILFASLSIVICCRKRTTTWYKTIQWMTFFVIISLVAAADGMLYTEFEFKEELSNGKRGLAYMISWAGTGFQFILFILIIAQLCIRPPPTVDTNAW
uniref:Uncharacterized protein n=1 Tax=Clytia hemisphaerica TaxID=252671 RepID=A0A7M5V5M0_9CNID|eukprot:TCONS_00024695-protein